jgi:hypothetical protein
MMDITARYNRNDFVSFLSTRFLPDDFETAPEEITPEKSTSYIKNTVKLGYCPSLDLSVYEFVHSSRHDPRVSLSREAFTILARYDNTASNALAVFYNEDSAAWRLSLITSEYSVGKTSKQAKRGFSNPRRFSYLLGEGCKKHTPETMLFAKGKIATIDDLSSRFAVDVVTKEFYRELFDWYDKWAVNVVKFPVGEGAAAGLPENPDVEENRQYLIRLVTRLIFVWFLKQKDNLIPKWIFKESEAAKVLKTFDPHSEKESNYYNGVIQNLFFATLNKEIALRGFTEKESRKDYGIKTVYRDHKDSPMFKISQEEFIKKFETVPFLNGGLFECLDRREGKEKQKYVDGFSREKSRAAFVPNCLFFGGGASGEHGAREGIIELFNRYNFTVEENTPRDIDIALDPELLGKVFENLLGTYNKETVSTARKESGSFYTPREIVDYMADTSLKEYFKGELKGGSLPPAPAIRSSAAPSPSGSAPKTPSDAPDETELEEKLDGLFSYHETGHDFDTGQVRLLMDAINNCKILDPACGSGAFPMGVLNKLTFIMEKLDPDNKLWEEIQIQKAKEETGEAFRIGDRGLREKRLKEISDVFELNKENYGRKLFLIENCIFGIDIQPIAIQISKLRFFISLIVDQKTGGVKENNYNVLPLPNLETKFVAANALIGVKREAGVLADPDIEKLQDELLVIRHKHFSARKADEKIDLRKEDAKLSKELLELLKKDGFYNSADAQKMADWNPYDQTKPSDFFDAYWMFGVKYGFDVVIGNPPYLKEGRVSKEVFQEIKGTKYYQGKMDLWYSFACLGINFLSKNGSLCFIATNNWVTSYGSSKLRNKVITDTRIIQLVDFGNFMIFENASIQTMVMLFAKDDKSDNYSFDYRKLQGDTVISDVLDLLNKRENKKAEYLKPIVCRNNYTNGFLTFSRNENLLIKLSKDKLFLNAKELGQGIVFPQDTLNKKNREILGGKFPVGSGIFVLTNKEKINLKLSESELRLIKTYYTTNQIDRYYTFSNNSLWTIYTDSTFKNPRSMDKYPNLKQHLDKYKNVITSDNKPYGLHRARDERFFIGEKIIVQRKCAGQPVFSYSDFECYVSAAFYIIKTERINLKCLLGILNSNLIAFWLKNKGKMQGENYQLDKEPLQGIPLPNVTGSKTAKEIMKLVDKILAAKAADPKSDTSSLEWQIDNLVYRLYNLTWEEVKVIKPGFPMSRTEYEGI